jgi:sugar phosphate permease
MHAPMALTNTWFIRLRARAMTINSAAYGLGGVLLTPILSIVVHTWGWRAGAAIAGMTFLLVGIPLCLTIRPSPESMGLSPDGDEHVAEVNLDKESVQSRILERNVTAAQAIRSFAFWALVFGAGVRNASYHAISTHFIPMMVWKGMSQQQATFLLSSFALLGFISTLVFGWLADNVNKPRLVHRFFSRPAFPSWCLSSAAPSAFCGFSSCYSPLSRRLIPSPGLWSAICSAANTSPKSVAI